MRACGRARRSSRKELGEFILPYDAVRTAANPRQALMEFLQSTYEAAADLGKWDRAALECAVRETEGGASMVVRVARSVGDARRSASSIVQWPGTPSTKQEFGAFVYRAGQTA